MAPSLDHAEAEMLAHTDPREFQPGLVRLQELPPSPLGRRMLKKLKVYSGTEHPHAAQQPKPLA